MQHKKNDIKIISPKHIFYLRAAVYTFWNTGRMTTSHRIHINLQLASCITAVSIY